MIGFENFARLAIFVSIYVLHRGKTEHDNNGVYDEIDPLPIPQEKILEYSEVFERSKRSDIDSLDDSDDSTSPRSFQGRYLPREFFEKKDQCDFNHILEMHKKCKCQVPKKKCVSISNPHGTVLSTMPECVFVDRCEGVCPFSTNCIPKVKEPVSVQVIVTKLVPESSGPKVAYECKTIQVEKHVKCRCACEITEEDCSPKQVFDSDICQCQCPNSKESKQCQDENKQWNSLTCDCECASHVSQDCSTGAFFHKTQCKCVPSTPQRAWRRRRI